MLRIGPGIARSQENITSHLYCYFCHVLLSPSKWHWYLLKKFWLTQSPGEERYQSSLVHLIFGLMLLCSFGGFGNEICGWFALWFRSIALPGWCEHSLALTGAIDPLPFCHTFFLVSDWVVTPSFHCMVSLHLMMSSSWTFHSSPLSFSTPFCRASRTSGLHLGSTGWFRGDCNVGRNETDLSSIPSSICIACYPLSPVIWDGNYPIHLAISFSPCGSS